MSYTNANWTCLSPSLNQGQQTITPFGSSTTIINAPNIFMYGSPTDTASAISTAGYFNPVITELAIGDWILGNGVDDSFLLRVSNLDNETVTVISISSGGGGGSEFLRKDMNLSDVDSLATSIANIGQGSGQFLQLQDSDFSGGIYTLDNPCPNYVEVFSNTPGNELRLPLANEVQSFFLGNGPEILTNGSESIDISTNSGVHVTTLVPDNAIKAVLTNNSTSDGTWEALAVTASISVLSGNYSGIVTLLSDDLDANENFTPSNYTPSAGSGFLADSITGNLKGIDEELSNFFPNIPLTQGELIIGTSTVPGPGILTSSDGSVIIDTNTDGQIDLTAGTGVSQSLQGAYEIGNQIELDADRPFTVFSQSSVSTFEAVTTPSTGLSSTSNYAVQGWYFTSDVPISVTALQYLDANLPSGTRQVGLYNKASGALLAGLTVTKTSPLVGFYRTSTLATPVVLSAGVEYVITTVVFPGENYNLNNDAVTSANISALGRATGAVSPTPISLPIPTAYIASPNITPEGYFQYQVITPGASIYYSAGSDGNSYFMKAESTTLGNIPNPVMSTDQFRAIPSKAIGLMAFSSNEFRPLAYNGIGANQLVAYVSDVGLQAEGGAYGIVLDSGNTSDATSINVVYSSYQRIQNRVNVTVRLTFVPTAIDPVISFYTLFNLVNFSNDDQASGLGNLWLSVNPTGLDGSAQIHSISGASSIEISMITPDFDSIKTYELNATYSYVIDPAGLLNPFITVWDTEAATPAAATVELPLVSTGTYDFIVDWGDGNFDRIQVWNDSAVTHVYDTAGIYTVKIYGTCEGWNFGVSAVAPLVIDVLQWGIVVLDDGTASDQYFSDCEYMTIISASDAPDLSGTTSLVDMFSGCTLLTRINNIGSWDVTTITDATDMFGGVTLDTDNYNALLVGWADQVVQNTVTFSGGNSTYDGAGVAARAVLTGTYSWVITDGGPA